MDKKLDFNEMDILNAAWSGMKAIKAKAKKDATDANALSKGLSSVTKYMELKTKWAMHCDKNPEAKKSSIPLLEDQK